MNILLVFHYFSKKYKITKVGKFYFPNFNYGPNQGINADRLIIEAK